MSKDPRVGIRRVMARCDLRIVGTAPGHDGLSNKQISRARRLFTGADRKERRAIKSWKGPSAPHEKQAKRTAAIRAAWGVE